jgi:hypothetical protein
MKEYKMSLKLIRHASGFKVLYDCERVGDIHFVSATHYRVVDIRNKDRSYPTKTEAIRHFTSFSWRSVLGPSPLRMESHRKYEPKPDGSFKQRWARS